MLLNPPPKHNYQTLAEWQQAYRAWWCQTNGVTFQEYDRARNEPEPKSKED